MSNKSNEKPSIKISYCPKCKWLLRSAWYAQELLNTFEQELGSVALEPSEVAGHFQIRLNEKETLWCRKENNGFPEIKKLKQIVRDRVAAEKDLGHSEG